MSRRVINTVDGLGRPVQVVMGWDRPLGGYFMTVHLMDEADEESAIYHHLKADETHPTDLSMYEVALDEMGVILPDDMWEDLQLDGITKAGNVIKEYADPLYALTVH